MVSAALPAPWSLWEPPSPFSLPAPVIRGRERDADCVFLTSHVVSIKREIGHLCHDENKPSKPNAPQSPAAMALEATPVSAPGMSTIFCLAPPHLSLRVAPTPFVSPCDGVRVAILPTSDFPTCRHRRRSL